MRLQKTLGVFTASVATAEILDGVPVGPPMGWNPWSRLQCEINQTTFTEIADSLVDTGLRDAGYTWVNLDDCWPKMERSKNGSLEWNETLFPKGLYELGRYIKDRKLKFGIYSDSGSKTCGGYPGSLDHEKTDLETFARWGIEYLKLDGCNVDDIEGKTSEQTYHEIYSNWTDLIKKMDKPLEFSNSAPAYFSSDNQVDNLTDWYRAMSWAPDNGQLARHSADVTNFKDHGPWKSIMFNYKENTLVARFQDRGYTNDPDFLISDHPELSQEEAKTQFTLYASLGAPLILSAWIPDMSDDMIKMLSNKDLIDVDQDKLGLQATLVARTDAHDILTRYLSNGDRLLTLLNRQEQDQEFDVSMSHVGYSDGCKLKAKDLWSGKEQDVDKSIKTKIPGHGAAVYRISGDCDVTPTGLIMNTKSEKCLDASNNMVTVEGCDDVDEQVWTIKNGVLKTLGTKDKCLAASDDGQVTLDDCSQNNSTQQWTYATSGNIKHVNTGHCLTGASQGLSVAACGDMSQDQVFEAPSGFLQYENPDKK